MGTKVWVAAVLLVACFLLVAGAAQAKAPLKCAADFYSDATMDHWEVAVTGDIDGTMYVHGDESVEWFFPGKTEHFFETWIMHPESGGWFSGTDGGVWSFVTFKFRANGWVTAASPQWQGLVGYKFHEVGTTTNPFIADWVAGEGNMFFAGP